MAIAVPPGQSVSDCEVVSLLTLEIIGNNRVAAVREHRCAKVRNGCDG
jgi:hypothetical protein